MKILTIHCLIALLFGLSWPALANEPGIAPSTILKESWAAYKKKFIQPDGRVIDPSAGDTTTSEGQSYAMLRSAWLDDHDTFHRLWNWSQNNLRQQGLFAWKWGKRCDGSWGILESSFAADADQDMALALIIAGNRWSDESLLKEAKQIIRNIWENEVVVCNDKPYLTAGNWSVKLEHPRLNPSYFAPYAYRIFARLDPTHNWNGLVTTTYEVLNQCSQLSRLELPPDWCDLDPVTGKISIDYSDKSSDYSYDAMRIPWRISLDWAWNADPRSWKYLNSLGFLKEFWKVQHTLRSSYSASGVMRNFDEPLAGFGCVLPYFHLTNPDLARQILQEKIMAFYYDGIWRPEYDYYGQNWAWFGIASTTDLLKKPSL